MRIIISKTGYQNGFGTDRYKSVAGLSLEERKIVIENNGEDIVLIKSRLSGGNHGTQYRRVYHNCYGYYPRVPSTEILKQLELQEEKK